MDLSTPEAVVTGASIHSLAAGRSAVAESAAWTQFSSPSNTAEFCAGWLSILCAQVDHVSGALVLLGSGDDGNYGPVAAWPSQKHNLLHLGPVAETTLKERHGVVSTNEADAAATLVGYPIEVEGKLYGAVVLDIKSRSEPDVQRALRLVHWGSAWLIDHFRQQLMGHQRQNSLHTSLVNEIVATSLQEERLGACALAVANELATRMKCERVSIGFLKGDSIEVTAISNTATFDTKSDFVRMLGDAMDEVLDLNLSMVHPPLEADAIGGLGHAGLSAARGEASVMSVPLVEDSDIAGVLTLERSRGQAFMQSELALFKTIGMVLGPIFALKRREELGLRERTWKALRASVVATLGPGHPGLKLITLAALMAFVYLSVATSTYRVNSKTVIEGEVQRAVVAPFQGYVAESMVRAGDSVTKGQILARLDDRELKLERARWASEAEQTHRKYRQAAAGQERAAMAISSAQEDQAQAQLALVDERLSRVKLLAPFDGVVVVGDLSQLLGSPVEVGKVLFEVAPLDAYRVVLNVDERDIANVVPGLQGELALAGMPYDRLPFTVHQVTPISTAQDGRNYFRVEARLAGSTIRLRPGMEGIGKVQVGERKLIWIWTHTFVEWLRLEAWRWFG